MYNVDKITPEDIGLYLAPYKERDWKFEYDMEKKLLIQSIVYGDYNQIFKDEKDINDLMNWMELNPNWLNILKSDDVALFPNCFRELKRKYLINKDKDYMESYLLNKNDEYLEDLISSNRANYGVFKFDCMVGHKMFRRLLKHLNMKHLDFINIYGESLFYDVNCLDDIISEMVLNGEITGEKRLYKLEDEFEMG